jgi:two-component system, NtrC family, sensor histidine kinase HydH
MHNTGEKTRPLEFLEESKPIISQMNRLVLVKSYLIGSLLAAIVPLLIMAAIYDWYSASLLSNLTSERIEGKLNSTAVKMSSFIDSHVNKLEDLADIPDIGKALQEASLHIIYENLRNFLQFEVGNPDIYGIIFYGINNTPIISVPLHMTQTNDFSQMQLPIRRVKEIDLIGPSMPAEGTPGWFLLKKDVFYSGKKVGAIAIKIRLASLTELAGSLYQSGVFKPVIVTPGKIGVTAVGTATVIRKIVAESQEFIPDWKIVLVHTGRDPEEPLALIRYSLLIIVGFSAMAIIGLQFRASTRLTRYLTPLLNGSIAISKGNFLVKVPENAPGTVGSLAKAFNQMSFQLGTLIQSRVQVERRVDLRNLATGMAHEVLNPLATIKISVQGLLKTDPDEERNELLQIIFEEVERIELIFEEFREYAHPRPPQTGIIPVGIMLQGVKVFVSAYAYRNNIAISISGDSSFSLYADSGQLRQILLNLMLNAIEAMPKGGHLDMRSFRRSKTGFILITDTGPGIAAENLDKIMNPFFTTKAKGTGMGLAMCRQLAYENSGKINIESVEGEGTTARLEIPLFLERLV